LEDSTGTVNSFLDFWKTAQASQHKYWLCSWLSDPGIEFSSQEFYTFYLLNAINMTGRGDRRKKRPLES